MDDEDLLILTPEFYAYRMQPTLENAYALLDSYRIPVPLFAMQEQQERHERYALRNPTNPNSVPSSAPQAPQGGAPSSTSTREHWQTNMAYLDLLHDLYEHGTLPNQMVMVDRLLNMTTLSPEKRREVKRVVNGALANGSFTLRLARIICDLPAWQTVSGKQHKSNGRWLFALEDNLKLVQILTGYQSAFAGHSMPLVIDGIYRAFTERMDASEAIRSLSLCAFVHIMFSLCPSIHMIRYPTTAMTIGTTTPTPPSMPVQEIRILSGFFQEVDFGQARFLEKLAADLSKHVGWVDAVRVERVAPTLPSHSMSGFEIKGDPPTLLYDGILIPKIAKNSLRRGIRANMKPANMMKVYERDFGLGYTKQDLFGMFVAAAQLNQSEWAEYLPFVRRVAHVNLFRDAYRVDVAVEKEAVFITGDRLAQVYYAQQTAQSRTSRTSHSLPSHPKSILLTYLPLVIEPDGGKKRPKAVYGFA